MTGGKILRNYRIQNNLSQPQLAEILGVTAGYISNLENLRKPLSKNIKLFLLNNADLSEEEKDFLQSLTKSNLSLSSRLKQREKELNEREKQLNKREREILSRQHKLRTADSSLALQADIREQLIKINSLVDKEIAVLEFHCQLADEKMFDYFKGSIKLTVNKLMNGAHKLEKIASKNIIEIID